MKKTLDKKQSILVLLIISLFSLSILCFSIKIMDSAKDLNLEATMARINTLIMEYYIQNNIFPKEELCNLKKDCLNFREKINIYLDQDIYYTSNEKDYILYSPSFVNKNIYFVTNSNFLINKVLKVPEL
ncbi:MAG: hypothetical protein ACOX0B_00200 [Minisyncoccales bacterium]|jgi:hypothetical protein